MNRETGIGYVWGQVSRGIPYRVFMQFIHRYGFHYAPKNQWLVEKKIGELTKKEVRTYPCWCKWCGLRGSVVEMDQLTSIR